MGRDQHNHIQINQKAQKQIKRRDSRPTQEAVGTQLMLNRLHAVKVSNIDVLSLKNSLLWCHREIHLSISHLSEEGYCGSRLFHTSFSSASQRRKLISAVCLGNDRLFWSLPRFHDHDESWDVDGIINQKLPISRYEDLKILNSHPEWEFHLFSYRTMTTWRIGTLS